MGVPFPERRRYAPPPREHRPERSDGPSARKAPRSTRRAPTSYQCVPRGAPRLALSHLPHDRRFDELRDLAAIDLGRDVSPFAQYTLRVLDEADVVDVD